MKYALLVFGGEGQGWSGHEGKVGMGASVRLKHPETATTVQVDGSERVLRDGTGDGALMGWVVIECPDLDAAVELAAGLPAARGGGVEIRPLAEGPP